MHNKIDLPQARARLPQLQARLGQEAIALSASSVLAWRIPGIGEPGGLPSMGSHRVGHD